MLTYAIQLGVDRARLDGVRPSADPLGTATLARAPSLRPHRLDGQHATSFLRQLGSGLRVRIEQGEVVHNNWYGQGNSQHASNGAQCTDEHAQVRFRVHVAVPNRRHGYDGPPQSDGYGREIIVRIVLQPLGVVDERCRDDDTQYQEEDQQHELVRRRRESVYENFKAWRVACQLEQPHYAHDAETVDDVTLDVEVTEHEVQVERQRCYEVNNVDCCTGEQEPVGRRNEAQYQLEREPRVAHALNVEKCLQHARIYPAVLLYYHSLDILT